MKGHRPQMTITPEMRHIPFFHLNCYIYWTQNNIYDFLYSYYQVSLIFYIYFIGVPLW
jgi:hypothetical protein